MPRVIALAVTKHEPYAEAIRQIFEQNRLLYGDAQEAAARTFQALSEIGGIDGILQRRQVAERWTEILNCLEFAYPGIADFIALIGCEDLESREARGAVASLAKCFGLKLKNPRTRKALIRSAKSSKKDYATTLHQHYFPEAIRGALSKAETPQRIRLGVKWEKTRGKVVPKIPSSLPLTEFYRWFRKQVYRELNENLDALDIAASDNFLVNEAWQREEFTGSSLGTEELETQASSDLLDLLSKRLTRRERELLAVFSKPAAEIAQLLGTTPSTIRVLKHRIRTKSRKISAG